MKKTVTILLAAALLLGLLSGCAAPAAPAPTDAPAPTAAETPAAAAPAETEPAGAGISPEDIDAYRKALGLD